MSDLLTISGIPGLIVLILAVPVALALILAPLKLFSIDKKMTAILEELKRLNTGLARFNLAPPPHTPQEKWLDELKEATEKTNQELERKLGGTT